MRAYTDYSLYSEPDFQCPQYVRCGNLVLVNNIGSVRGLAYQWYHWFTNGTNCTIGKINGTISITIGTNGITNGTIGKTLNDIGIPLAPYGNPERTHYSGWSRQPVVELKSQGWPPG